MPRLHVVAVAARLPGWAEEACADYVKRMPRGYEVERTMVKRVKLPKNSRIVALDERGKDLTTVQFAELLKIETTFVIGGPDGLDAAVKQSADLLWSLSPLTLPHGLARVVLAEQLYRAVSILHNHPYHRE